MTEAELATRAQNRNEWIPSNFPVNTLAYASGMQLGLVMTISGYNGQPNPFDGDCALSAILQDFLLVDNSGQNQPVDVFFFNTMPSFNTDHVAWAPTPADMLNCIGKVSLVAGQYSAAGATQAVGQVPSCGIVLKPKMQAVATGPAIYAVLVIRGAGTYAANALLPKFHFSQGL